jgi:3-oxoacyl-[acyl-carrier-protein] synthase-3
MNTVRINHEADCGLQTTDYELNKTGIFAISLHTEASHSEILTCEGSGTADRTNRRIHENGTIRMDGRKVFSLAVRALFKRSCEVLDKAGVTLKEVDCIIPHQANIRIIESLAHQLGCYIEKIFINLHKYGNTSSASVPIALSEAMETGRVGKGSLVLCAAAGAGFSSGAILLRL